MTKQERYNARQQRRAAAQAQRTADHPGKRRAKIARRKEEAGARAAAKAARKPVIAPVAGPAHRSGFPLPQHALIGLVAALSRVRKREREE